MFLEHQTSTSMLNIQPSFAITGIKYILKYITITGFTYFWTNKFSLGGHKY